MAKKTTESSYTGGRKAKAKTMLDGDPPILIGGGGSIYVFFKDNANEIIPSPKDGYRCFRLGGNLKNVSVYDGMNPGTKNTNIKDPKTAFVQCDGD